MDSVILLRLTHGSQTWTFELSRYQKRNKNYENKIEKNLFGVK